MADNSKPKRQYHRITAAQLARYKALEISEGNGAAAVRILTPTVQSAKVRAFRMRTKINQQSTLEFIDDQLQQIGSDAINNLGELVNSNDERIRTKNVHYVIDHLRGKPVAKSITLHGKANIQSVLD